ncbi:facilitated trehalose transporter Tret1-2 homolog [Dendroctonus ponderosae]|uniref:Major facilitator superfamily (MFS) profile domain-containing protein n=1 Tax=Dendroctonus ponderosae TaxID=77166 RepID=A0AAR5PBQ9_DENPD|nr:facilitated trehalose transporter Tret1-2 homolog [Dendroctonus ponderosae]
MPTQTQSKGTSYFIYFAVFSVNLITFSAGGCWSWTSPILPKLNSPDPAINPLPRPTTTFEDSWIASVMNLGAIVGPLAGGFCSERFGKKKALLILGLPIVISHLLCALAVNVHFFLAARFLIGIGAGTVFGVVPGYVGDIVEDRQRGVMGSMLGVFNCFGVLFMYLVGPFVSVQLFSLINLIAPILFYILFGFFVPESPYDLVKQGKEESAEISLMKLRGREVAGDVQKELTYITESIDNSSGQPSTICSLFQNKALRKAMLISNGLMFFQQFSGICAVIGYMQTIFEMTGSSIPSIYSAILIGAVQLLSNIASSQLVEKAGRRVLLVVSHLFSAVSLITLGAYFFLMSSGFYVEEISWLPITSLILFIVAFNLGLANLPWVVLAELFPANMKSISATSTTFFSFTLSFVVTMGFPFATELLGMPGTFWTFSAVLVAGFLFCIALVPETKGRTSQEIQNLLEGLKK